MIPSSPVPSSFIPFVSFPEFLLNWNRPWEKLESRWNEADWGNDGGPLEVTDHPWVGPNDSGEIPVRRRNRAATVSRWEFIMNLSNSTFCFK